MHGMPAAVFLVRSYVTIGRCHLLWTCGRTRLFIRATAVRPFAAVQCFRQGCLRPEESGTCYEAGLGSTLGWPLLLASWESVLESLVDPGWRECLWIERTSPLQHVLMF